jgi:hypothetical protein
VDPRSGAATTHDGSVTGQRFSRTPTGIRTEPVWKFDTETRRTYTADPTLIGIEAPRIAPEERRSEHVITDDPLTYEAGQGSGCAGVWSSPAVDIELGAVFFGTAHCNFDEMPDGEIGGEGVW